jgi:LacI family transcriptional regulator
VTVTIREVAHRARVSVATVSRVLNDSGPVGPETRRRVQEAVEELGYVPHGGARSLIMRRTNVLGVVLPELYSEFFSEVIRGLERPAQQAGYHLLLSSSHDNKQEIKLALRAMQGRVDGLIVMSPHVGARELKSTIPAAFPAVLLNCAVEEDSPFDSVSVDNFGGACDAVRHLLTLGHERIALIGGGAADNHDAWERQRGYRAALCEAGVAPRPEWEVVGHFLESGGHEAATALSRLRPRPTAIFAANDSMAFGAMSALGKEGLRVPEDMAICGFDDVPMARYWNPPLTSVHVDLSVVGACTVKMLLEALAREDGHGRRESQHRTVGVSLAVRSSCGSGGPHRSTEPTLSPTAGG